MSLQFSHSVVSDFETLWTAACQASLPFTLSLSLLKFRSTHPSIHLILCHPLLLLPSIFPRIRVFSNELALCISWPKSWSFSFNISPSNEYLGLISFRIDWFDLLAVQEMGCGGWKDPSSRSSSLPRSSHSDLVILVEELVPIPRITTQPWGFRAK